MRRGPCPGRGLASRRGQDGAVSDAPDRQRRRTPSLRGIPRTARRRVRDLPLGGLGRRRASRSRRGRGRLRDHAPRAGAARARGQGRSGRLRRCHEALDPDRPLGDPRPRRGPVPPIEGCDALARADPRGATRLGSVEAQLRVRGGVPRREVRDCCAPGCARRDRDRSPRPRTARRASPRGDADVGAWGATLRRGGHGGRLEGPRVQRRDPHAAQAAVRRRGQEDRRAHLGPGVGARVRAPPATSGRDRAGGERQDRARGVGGQTARDRRPPDTAHVLQPQARRAPPRIRRRVRRDRHRDVPPAVRPDGEGGRRRPSAGGCGARFPLLRAPAPRRPRRGRGPAGSPVRRDRGR